tara:strand:- start:767 stop:1069 length:303 start_codon:yes stop_codon:yes gene_type:complete
MDSEVINPITPHSHTNTPTHTVEIAVPTNAKAQIPSKLRKNELVSKENPLSKIIGGKRRKKKISSLKSTYFVICVVAFDAHINRPTVMPNNNVAPASGSQ